MSSPLPGIPDSITAPASRRLRLRELGGAAVALVVAFALGWWIQPAPAARAAGAGGSVEAASVSRPRHDSAGSNAGSTSANPGFTQRFLGVATTRDLAGAAAERDELRRNFELGEWAERLRPDEFSAEFARLAAKYPASWDHLEVLLKRWTSLDPAAALAAVQARPLTEHGMLAGVISGWAVRDPEAAFAWIRAPSAMKVPNEAMLMDFFISALIEQDRTDEMVDYASRVAGNPAMTNVLARVAITLARRDPDLAAQWSATVPPGPMYDRVFGTLVAVQALTQPERAAENALAQPAVGARNDALRQAARTWATNSPEAALRWAVSRRTEAQVAPMLGVLIPETLRTASPATTESLLDALPAESPERISALHAIIPRLAHTDPTRAIDYALRYSAPPFLTNNLTAALQPWGEKDPAAARRFVAEDPRLTAAQRDSLRRTVTPRK